MNRHRTLLTCVLLAASVPIICAAAYGYIFYWRPDPASPPPTESGVNVEFDGRLRDLAQHWTLLFREHETIVATDGEGRNPEVIVNLQDVAPSGDPLDLSHETISTNGLRLSISSYTFRDPDHGGPILEALIVDLRNGHHLSLPLPSGDFELEPASGFYWLSDDLIVVKTHRYTGEDASSEQLRFLLFDAQYATLVASFEFPPCPMFATLSEPSASLLVASDCAPPSEREVWAIDSSGKRRASTDEAVLFDERERNRYPPLREYHHPSAQFPLIRIENVSGGTLFDFGSFFHRNWNRFYMYLGEDVVRVSDAHIQFDADWQAGLELFIWTEGDRTYVMDPEGHYRLLHDGVYLGRILLTP